MFNILDAWRAQRHIRKTRSQLDHLSDQMLADIGISRSEIRLVGRNGLRRTD